MEKEKRNNIGIFDQPGEGGTNINSAIASFTHKHEEGDNDMPSEASNVETNLTDAAATKYREQIEALIAEGKMDEALVLLNDALLKYPSYDLCIIKTQFECTDEELLSIWEELLEIAPDATKTSTSIRQIAEIKSKMGLLPSDQIASYVYNAYADNAELFLSSNNTKNAKKLLNAGMMLAQKNKDSVWQRYFSEKVRNINELIDMNEEIKANRTHIAKLDEVEVNAAQLEENIKNMRTSLDEANANANDIAEERDEYKKEIELLQTKSNDASEAHSKSVSEFDALLIIANDKLKENSEQINALNAFLDSAQSQANDTQKKIKKLEMEKNDLIRTIKELSAALKNAYETNAHSEPNKNHPKIFTNEVPAIFEDITVKTGEILRIGILTSNHKVTIEDGGRVVIDTIFAGSTIEKLGTNASYKIGNTMGDCEKDPVNIVDNFEA